MKDFCVPAFCKQFPFTAALRRESVWRAFILVHSDSGVNMPDRWEFDSHELAGNEAFHSNVGGSMGWKKQKVKLWGLPQTC